MIAHRMLRFRAQRRRPVRSFRAWLAAAATLLFITCENLPTFPAVPRPGNSALRLPPGFDSTAGASNTVSDTVRDIDGNPLPGIAVTFAVTTTSTASFQLSASRLDQASTTSPCTTVTATNSCSTTTGPDGIARVVWVLSTTAGTQTLTATAGLQVTTLTVTVPAGAATQLAINGGNGQSAMVNTPVASPPSVIVKDRFNNPVRGVSVTFAITSGGGSVTGASTTTNGSGVATVGSWTLGTTVGPNSLTATGANVAGSPLTFTATATTTASGARVIAATSATNLTGTAGLPVSPLPSVIVTDAFGNPLSGVSVTFAVASGGGSVTGGSATTNTSGIATVGSWTLGKVPGSNTLTATSGSTSGNAVTFTATGNAGAAATIAANTATSLTATAGTEVLPPPSVLITDSFGNPVSGVLVSFAVVSGGGAVTGGITTSNPSGIATVGGWTLSGTAGTDVLSATSAGLNGSPVRFTATGTVGAGRISKSSGDVQSAAVNTNVAIAPTVLISDANGNPIGGASVTFSVASGGGSVVGGTTTTNANGSASVTSWKLGTLAGPNTLTATAASAGSVTFTATGTAGVATQIAITPPGTSNGQSATVGTAVAVAPSVTVSDAFGNAKSGVAVAFAVTSGGGSVAGGAATSNASGIATVGSWTLGPTAGANTLTASSAGLTGSPVTFTATGVTGTGTISVNAGNNQSATVGTNVATAGSNVAPSVSVKDNLNNPVVGLTVTFAVASGGGSVTGASTTTNSQGVATVGSWTLGNTAGSNALTASAAANGSPVTFTATGTAGAPSTMALSAGNNQSANAGSAVPIPPAVMIRDAFGNPVSGVAVTFAVASGGGSATGTSATSSANGIATVGSWTLGNVAGSNSMTATSAAVAGVTITFTATGTVGSAATIALNAGNGQSATVNSAVATPPSVIVKDAAGNPVNGVAVTFAVASGGGSVAGGSATTNASGIATVGSWTLGTAAGGNTLTATSGSLSGSPVTFTATGTAGSAATIALSAGNAQSATVNTAVAVSPSVLVTDAYGNPVSGVPVTFAVASGGGSATGVSTTTNASGIAAVGSWTLGTVAGSNSLTASSAGLTGSPITFTATGTAGAAVSVIKIAGDGQTAVAGSAVATPPSVRVQDAYGNAVSGVAVTFAVVSGGGSVVPTSAIITDANGIATVTSWTLGVVPGSNSLSASAGSLAATFTATGI